MFFPDFTNKSAAESLKELKSSENGLSKKEALLRQKKFGLNQLPQKETYWWHILLRQFKSSFIYLLFVASAIALYLGSYLDSLMILGFILINALLGFYQEFRSEQTLKLLKQFIKRTVKVRRAGQEMIIESKELVPGDIVIVEAGDIIPADLRFIAENDLMVDESVLTGESVPIKKIASKLKSVEKELYKATNIGFSSTTVVSGKGEGVVIATGSKMELGKISKLVSTTKRASSFEKNINKLSKFILQLIIITLVFVFLANIFIKGPRVEVAEFLLFSIALAVCVIPEALPVVTTFSLSRGAMRLAKHQVVIKRLSAIEDLGSIEILCTDKTGTLTKNELKVAEVLSPHPQEAVFYASLASSFLAEKTKQPNNAFDLALFARLSHLEKKKIKGYEIINSLPFDPERKRNSVLVKSKEDKELIVRGAPEVLLDFCKNLNQREKKTFSAWLTQEGRQGRRVIAIAKKEYSGPNQYNFKQEEKGLSLLGLISFVDPIKPTTKSAVNQAKKLSVEIKVLTGDNKEVAGAVARQIGLIDDPGHVISGEEFDKLPDKKKRQAVKEFSVFARVSPSQKYRIIQILQETNEVGFLGEGINDAPSLKIANVSLVVQEASDIAREAADIILLRKNLGVIIDGIKEGREVFANTFKYVKYTISSNLGNFYAIAIASLFIDFLPMLPLQILLVNLLSDFPMIAVATDNVDEEELKKPRNYNIKEIALQGSIFGIISSIFDFIFFVIFFRLGAPILQTGWFIESILSELVFIFSIRTKKFFLKGKRPSNMLMGMIGLAFVATIIIPFTFWGQKIFKFISLSGNQILIILAIVAAYFVVNEIIKNIYFRNFNNKGKA
ncbi:MAG TPA: magnesium-translocating P-type ATPase [Candidatus Uhrbacteria bacterium]|nr:magnesium-translocating P-type ATPase [Candidatus Uhrbacteria bacterium]